MVEAIGSTLGGAENPARMQQSLNQNDLIRLFMAQLNFQDPMKPVDNREFLAQMAQFAGLEQSRQTTKNMEQLVFMNSTAQSLGLLGREVEVVGESGPVNGEVTVSSFTPQGPRLTVKLENDDVLTDVRMSQVRLVRF